MRTEEIAAQLQQFSQDPQAAASQHPEKEIVLPGSSPAIDSLFSPDDIKSGAYVSARDSYRKQLCTERQGQRVCLDQILPGKAPFAQNDLVEDLVDVADAQILRRLEDMERNDLKSARLSQVPWSSTYWPTCQGGIGARYADPLFPKSTDWKQNHSYLQEHPAAGIVAAGNPAALDLLSPAEKYDLLVGDDAWSLTSAAWEEGSRLAQEFGTVESWQGICHGWAPAAYMLQRPVYKVIMPAADGKTRIVLYPSDIKALGALLWAKTRPSTRFIGGRCNEKNPPHDQYGRILSQSCFDTNPGTWHMSIVNQIGLAKRSLVLDATYDYEVWNQPAYSYEYAYFNPKTLRLADNLDEATVARADFSNDRYAHYRAKNTQFFVGIAMNFYYIVETVPTHKDHDSPSDDAARKVSYLYDLELDADRNIIGGEWYHLQHPDFLWTPTKGAKALSVADYAATENWSGSGTLPASWIKAAIYAARLQQPLAKIIDVLFNFAQ
jgi:hypothetical protein